MRVSGLLDQLPCGRVQGGASFVGVSKGLGPASLWACLSFIVGVSNGSWAGLRCGRVRGVPGRGFPWPCLSGTLALVQFDVATAMQPVGRWSHLGPLTKWRFLGVEREMVVLLEGSRPRSGGVITHLPFAPSGSWPPVLRPTGRDFCYALPVLESKGRRHRAV